MMIKFAIIFAIVLVSCFQIVKLAEHVSCETANCQAIQELINATEEISQKLDALIATGICSQPAKIPSSCQEIKEMQPNSPSGIYQIAANNKTNYVYCHMEKLCGTEGGWARLAYLDMSNSTENCPTGFKTYESNGVRACGRPTSARGGCQSVKFPSNGVSYSQVCGRVVGYQYGSPDALKHYSKDNANHYNISSYYVDGISITHGYPHRHIWTLMCGVSDSQVFPYANCPCSKGSKQVVQSFIGNDYFCESGDPDLRFGYKLYTQDPLWDGKDCGANEGNCCSAAGLPWFNKVLNCTTTDYIELRVCGDQTTRDEDVPVSFYEIYVK